MNFFLRDCVSVDKENFEAIRCEFKKIENPTNVRRKDCSKMKSLIFKLKKMQSTASPIMSS